MTMAGRLESSREAILEILRHRDGVSVDELSHALGLAGATVRRHLDVLMRDGYVSVSQIRGGTGRPRYAFALTEAGTELFSQHYVRLTRRLLEEMMALGPDETAGRSGEQLASLIFEKLADRLAREYAPRVEGDTVEERARSGVALLAADGFDYEVQTGGGGVRLFGRGCPCRRFGPGGDACQHDRTLLERVMGAPVTALDRAELPADFACGYQVG